MRSLLLALSRRPYRVAEDVFQFVELVREFSDRYTRVDERAVHEPERHALLVANGARP
jgi:hypothetical protein